MTTWIMGVLGIIGFCGYLFLFNYIAYKIFNVALWEGTNYDPLGAILMPMLAPLMVFILFIMLPMVVGSEILGY